MHPIFGAGLHFSKLRTCHTYVADNESRSFEFSFPQPSSLRSETSPITCARRKVKDDRALLTISLEVPRYSSAWL
jgi:hypothetical protein